MVLALRKTNWFHRQSKRQSVFLRRSWGESRNSLLAEPNFKEPIETRNRHKHQDFKILLHLWSASARHCCHRPTRPRPSSSLCRHPGAGEPLLDAARWRIFVQSCQINSRDLRRHSQSLKHLPWASKGQRFMLINQLGSVKALLAFTVVACYWNMAE